MKVTIARSPLAAILVTAAAGLTVSLAAAPLPPVTDRTEIRPAFIASTSQVFAPTITAGAVEVRPAPIASSATVFAPTVQPGAVSIAPAFIASTSFVSSPLVERIDPGAVVIQPAFITSTATVFAPSVTPGAVTVSPAMIEPSSFVLAPDVRPDAATVSPAFIPSGAFVPSPVVRAGAASIAPAFIGSTSLVAAPSVQPGPVTIAPAFIASTALVFAPTVSAVAAGYDADAQAYFDAMTVQPDATRKGVIDTLVKGLKTDGVWAKLDWLVLLAAHNAQAGRLNARAPSKTLAAVNSPAFTVDRGYMGDASAAFLDFGEPLAFTNANFSLDNASLFYWCNQGSASVGLQGHVGNTGAARASISARNNSGNNLFSLNDTSATAYAGTGVRTGFRSACRADAASRRIYNAGALTLSASVASSSVSATNGCALRSTASYSDDRLAAVGSGANLTDAQNTALYNRLNTYLTAIGAA